MSAKGRNVGTLDFQDGTRSTILRATRKGVRGSKPDPQAELELIAGKGDAAEFDGLGQATANGTQHERGDVTFRSNGEIRGFAWEFIAAIKMEAGFFQEFRGEAHVLAAIDTPEPQFFLVALEKGKRFLKLLHRAVKGRGEEENS
jgi:hypothetical protein